MPGESAAPGTTTGKTGSPTAQTAGTAFNVTVRSVDASWNLISTNDTVHLTSSDSQATLPANTALSSGTRDPEPDQQDRGQPDGDGFGRDPYRIAPTPARPPRSIRRRPASW